MRVKRMVFGAKKPLFMKGIFARNMLSFGPEHSYFQLEQLNVLIGPNGSGKSNLVELLAVLRASADDIKTPIRDGGGISDWIFKGKKTKTCVIGASFSYPTKILSLKHQIRLYNDLEKVEVVGEWITSPGLDGEKNRIDADEESGPPIEEENNASKSWFVLPNNSGSLRLRSTPENKIYTLPEYDDTKSVLSQRGDPDRYPELAFLIESYKKVAIYREWNFGRDSIYRGSQKTDLRTDKLEEDFSNLALFLHKFKKNVETKKRVLELLHELNESFDDFDVSLEGGSAQIFFTEGSFTVPANRLSDGTLRFLCLIAILIDPNPPALICIEEPELGLHPDIIPVVADMIIQASKRTQLIVTTHSDVLVDAMTEVPTAIVVCEKHEGQTSLKRLTAEEVAPWLDKYRLGQLWNKGQLGGNRW